MIHVIQTSDKMNTVIHYLIKKLSLRDTGHAFSHSARMMYDIVRSIEGGATVKITHPDGVSQRLVIDELEEQKEGDD